MSPKIRITVKILGVVLVIGLLGYWFFMHTVRGSSIAVYVIGGWHAPVSVKFDCAKETDGRVVEKFKLPLAFDEATKDQLRGFWYYSYYRGCLFAHGYDFSGNPVPKSVISVQGATSTYSNVYGGFSLDLPGTFSLDTSNALDVDWDDQLFVSKLSLPAQSLTVDTYLKREHFISFDDIVRSYTQYPFSTTPVQHSEVLTTSHGMKVLRVDETDGTTRLIFMLKNGHIGDMHSSPLTPEAINSFLSSLSEL